MISARKAGSEIVSGEYVLNIDSDDYIGDGYFQRISDMIDDSNADMIAWGYTRINKVNGKSFPVYNAVECGLYEEERLEEIKRSYLYDPTKDEINEGSLLFNLANKAIKRDIYVKNQPKVPDGITEAEDAATNWMVIKDIKSLYVSDMIWYYYRLNPKSITAKVTQITIERQKKLEEFLLQTIDHEGQLLQVRGFSFYRVIFIIDRAIKQGYKDYKDIVKWGEEYNIFNLAKDVKLKNISLGNALRRFFIRKHWWWLLFVYHKARSKANQR